MIDTAQLPSDSARHRILTLARHEYRAAVRNRILLALIAILVIVTAASVYVATASYRSKLADYEAYRAAAEAGGLQRIAPSPLRLLSLLEGAVEYLGIIGAIIGIALGYLTVSRERTNKTLPLLRSRPVSPGEMAAGSALGALAVIGTLVAATALMAVLCLGLIGNDWVDGAQTVRLLLIYVSAAVYMGVFYCLGAIMTARSEVAVNGLMFALGIWLIVVLILPQIGDTLDADNQVPGGLFAALTLNRADETTVLKKFSTYETIRRDVEEASFSKHFERFAFAMADVHEKYRGLTLSELLGKKHNDIIWLIVYPLVLGCALVVAFRRMSVTT